MRALVLTLRNFRARWHDCSGIVGSQHKRAGRQFATIDESPVLLRVQQVTTLGAFHDEPVIQSDIVIGNEFQPACRHAVRAGLGEAGKRFHGLSGAIHATLIGESLPGKPAVPKFESVAFERKACGLVATFMTCAGSNERRESKQKCARKGHRRGTPVVGCVRARRRQSIAKTRQTEMR